MKVLLTGGCGFSGSYIAEELYRAGHTLTILDCLTYAGKMEHLAALPREGYRFFFWDFRQPLPESLLDLIGEQDVIIHCGAETHVRTSFSNPALFLASNTTGTLNLLDVARKLECKLFLYVSTDEVLGTQTEPQNEQAPLNPSNPYSASKAAGELLVKVYNRCYGLPYVISRTMNLYGKRQDAEKFIPNTIEKIKRGETVQIHADEHGTIGSRQWLFVKDQSKALLFLLENGKTGTFHIAGERKNNLEVAEAIAERLNLPLNAEIVDAYTEFPGHDLHYALDDSLIRSMGFTERTPFETGIRLTCN